MKKKLSNLEEGKKKIGTESLKYKTMSSYCLKCKKIIK